MILTFKCKKYLSKIKDEVIYTVDIPADSDRPEFFKTFLKGGKATADKLNESDLLSAMYGQLSTLKQAMDIIVRNKKEEGVSDKSGKLCFKFTQKEFKAMPEYLKKIFIINDLTIPYRITGNGYYEARLRRKNITIEASGKDFSTMHRRFIDRLMHQSGQKTTVAQPQNVMTPPAPVKSADTVLFNAYAQDWLKIKEQTTKPSTYKEYERTFRVDLAPKFEGKYLGAITRADLQTYLFAIVNEGKNRKAEKLALMLNCIFDMAADDFGITSPMKNVVLPHYQSKQGAALTKDEEQRLVGYCKTHKNVEGTDALLVLLFFGLRKSELKSIKIIEGQWLQCETSKERLGQNVVLRKIPFTPMAKKILPYIDFDKARNVNLNTISTRMKRLFPNHHPHELRHTFISRCKECGVASEVVSIWAGHSLSGTITTVVYTHYSDEFQLKEAEKVEY